MPIGAKKFPVAPASLPASYGSLARQIWKRDAARRPSHIELCNLAGRVEPRKSSRCRTRGGRKSRQGRRRYQTCARICEGIL